MSPLRKLKSVWRGMREHAAATADRRLKVAYVGGWLGKQNLGDDALLAAYQRLFPGLKFVHFDGGRVSRASVSRLGGLRGGILAGGTLIAHKRSWLEITRSFLEICPEMFVFGTGVEERSFWPGETTVADWKPVLEQCRSVGVRGPLSAAKLTDAGIANVEVVGDPVIAFACDEVNTDYTPGTLGLNIGVSDGKVWGEETRICEETARLAKEARQAGWKVAWFVVWPKDLDITRQAAEISGTTADIRMICEDHQEFLRQLRSLSVFAGMKLHATVLATCALTPSVMLEYRPKCHDYMESINQAQFCIRTDRFRAGEVWEILKEWNENRLQSAEALAASLLPVRDRQRARAARIESLLCGDQS